MSQLCSIHLVPVSDWTLECPACTADRKRQEDALDAQRAQQEAIERQTEQLREAAEAEAERAMEAQWALDDLAATSKARLEEDRLHRQAEAERATLRAGVRELTPSLQAKWQDAAAKRAQILEEAKSFYATKASLTASINSNSAARTRVLQELVEREADTVQRALSSPAPFFLAHLSANRLAPADRAQRLEDALRHAAEVAKPFLSGRVVSVAGDPTLATTVWPVLRSLEHARRSVRVPPHRERPSTLFFGISTAIAAAIMASFALFRGGGALAASFFVLVGAGIFLAFVLNATFQEARWRPHLEFSAAFADLKRALAENGAPGTSDALHMHLTRAYVLSSVDTLPAVESYQAVTREVEKDTRDLEALEQAFRDRAPEREKYLLEYSFLREEVMRVGREIIEGIRAPGRLLQAMNCKQCGGPTTSETRQCPYCRTRLISPVEA